MEKWIIILSACGLIAGVLIWWLKAIKNSGEPVEYDDGSGYTDEDYTDLVNELHEIKVRYDAQVSCNKPLTEEIAELKKRIFILEHEKGNVIAARDALFRTVIMRDETIKDLKSDLQDAIAQRNKAEELLKAFEPTYDSQKGKMDELNKRLANDYINNNGRIDKQMETATVRKAENCP